MRQALADKHRSEHVTAPSSRTGKVIRGRSPLLQRLQPRITWAAAQEQTKEYNVIGLVGHNQPKRGCSVRQAINWVQSRCTELAAADEGHASLPQDNPLFASASSMMADFLGEIARA